MRARLRRWAWYAAVAAFLAVALNPALAWRMQGALRRSLATPYVRVRLVGWPTAAVTGRFARVSVTAHRASAGGLVVDEFAARLQGVSLDPLRAVLLGQFAVRGVEGGQATVRLLQEDVQRALEDRPYIEGATVRFAGGTVQISGRVTAAGAKVDAELAGRLVVEGTRQIVLHVETMSLSGLSLPPGVANLVIAPVNPLLSVDAFPVPLRLLTVEVFDGSAVITAEPR